MLPDLAAAIWSWREARLRKAARCAHTYHPCSETSEIPHLNLEARHLLLLPVLLTCCSDLSSSAEQVQTPTLPVCVNFLCVNV